MAKNEAATLRKGLLVLELLKQHRGAKGTDDLSGHKQITAPKESGNYRYLVVFHWNELQSKASYVFDAMVR